MNSYLLKAIKTILGIIALNSVILGCQLAPKIESPSNTRIPASDEISPEDYESCLEGQSYDVLKKHEVLDDRADRLARIIIKKKLQTFHGISNPTAAQIALHTVADLKVLSCSDRVCKLDSSEVLKNDGDGDYELLQSIVVEKGLAENVQTLYGGCGLVNYGEGYEPMSAGHVIVDLSCSIEGSVDPKFKCDIYGK